VVAFDREDREFGDFFALAAALREIAIRAPEGFADELWDGLGQGSTS
jgi:hypothetical protein